MKHVFVITHYKTIQDTYKCIESIMSLDNSNEIVIVDNGSEDGSYNKLKNKYDNFKKIHFIVLEKNIGFASANNIGYTYAKEKLHADFIEVCNNDTIIESTDFINVIEEKYYRERYYVAGPNLYNEDGAQQPLNIKCLNKVETIRKIVLYKAGVFLCNIGFYKCLSKKSNKIAEKQVNEEKSVDDTFLQGAFIIYSPLWVDHEEFAFYPGTFLYLEELLLKKYCKRKNYKYNYIFDTNVYHKGGASTSEVCRSTKDKYVFCLKHSIKSLRIYLKMINNERT